MTALAVSSRGAPAHPAGSTPRLAWRQFQYDLGAFFRNRQARCFTLALPLLFLVIFASVFTSTTKVAAGRSTPRSTTSPASSRWRSSAPHSGI